MSYQQNGAPYQSAPQDVVSGEQYRYALTNFRIAHEKVEQQRAQLEEQEQQVALLRARIALLEGGSNTDRTGKGGNSVDDFSIKNAASQLDKLINRWASEIVRSPPASFDVICSAVLSDVQYMLRHAMSETISEGIINCLMVTNSTDANIQLARIHEHLFARTALINSKAATINDLQVIQPLLVSGDDRLFCGSRIMYSRHVCRYYGGAGPKLMRVLGGAVPAAGGISILESAYDFSRMLHGSNTTSATRSIGPLSQN
ncbi:uncharacterized protein ARMOST_22654 [Armillaria ostoyae]|uniref:Uncharacterized protein n=1 Tax=Armillaria ostoyae TaxID=47428 RepID=A0A284SDG3_ARMOS|nr:uncharacterized protein ARMOST_22654 [Armillaria ostoyae]